MQMTDMLLVILSPENLRFSSFLIRILNSGIKKWDFTVTYASKTYNQK